MYTTWPTLCRDCCVPTPSQIHPISFFVCTLLTEKYTMKISSLFCHFKYLCFPLTRRHRHPLEDKAIRQFVYSNLFISISDVCVRTRAPRGSDLGRGFEAEWLLEPPGVPGFGLGYSRNRLSFPKPVSELSEQTCLPRGPQLHDHPPAEPRASLDHSLTHAPAACTH